MAPAVEKRFDPTEQGGKKYTFAAFEKFYGKKDAKALWKKAGRLEEAQKGKKAPKKAAAVERRRDPTDPQSKKTYTRDQFDKFYGEHGKSMWKKAGKAFGTEGQKEGKKGGKKDGKKEVKKEVKKAGKPIDKELLAEAVKAATSKPAKTVTLIAPFAEGMPESKHFKIVESEVPAEVPDKALLLELLCVSADPYLRPVCKRMPAGAPMEGFVVGRVLASKIKKWKPGQIVGSNLPFTTVQVVTQEKIQSGMMWDLTGYLTEETASHGVGVLGMPGSTAYGGVMHILKPKKFVAKKGKERKPEVLFVSAASGAVGQLVGQIAKKVYKCTVIGSAGGPEKCALLKEKFGFDHAIDYKSVKDADALAKELKECTGSEDAACIDMYFENVGGMHFDAAFKSLKPGGRIAVCGCISQYNEAPGKEGANSIPLWAMIYPQLRIEGFVCFRWLSGKEGTFLDTMGKLYKRGAFKLEETVTDGIDHWPEAFQSLFTGKNKGKVVVKCCDPLPLRKAPPAKTAKE
eukprot:TRINITY_DN9744_c0_g1_i1.p2 TRINITY_DN9744_c0_g1~~TRINITY_DN9744_c0_g1_i1.p2  ORF type:complete len:516 (+),score=213.17 TRINITY_DN9744_c0_g1_i1:58-1605(+)